MLRASVATALVLLLPSCSSSPAAAPPEAVGPAGAPCAGAGCGETARAPELGGGDGSAAGITLTEVYRATGAPALVDLAFHPERTNELWVVGYADNSTHVGRDVDTTTPTWTRLVDPAARHFMHRPPALAMGAGNTWATCGDNDNGQNRNAGFMGPTLFSADLAVFAKPATELGSHLDMLHSTSFCRGIAHEAANIYWVFNGALGSLDRYNFNVDHGPGNDDHADGEIYRYAAGQVRGASDGTPSHVVFDAEDRFLYVADTGHQRVVRLDTTKGRRGPPLPRNEPLKASALMEGTAVEVVVDASVLTRPSGIEVRGGLVYVTDAATSTFHVFQKSGAHVQSLATGLPAGSLAGFAFGPDGKIWFTDRIGGRVLRIDPRAAHAME